jgi:hypothetical protein
MSKRSFIAVERGILDHPVIGARKPFSDCEAWLWLLFEAVWKPWRVRAINGRAAGVLSLERGQLTYSQSYMARAWGWSEKRVRGFLFRLERERQIARQTGHLQTVITICNYELYQSPLSSKDRQTDRQTDRQRAGKGREEEEGNKDNKVIGGGGEPATDFAKSVGNTKSDRPLIKAEAFQLADDLAKVCGYDLAFLPPAWAGAAIRVNMMLDQGWRPELMLERAKSIVAQRKARGEDPPESIRYFEKAFARAHAPQPALPAVPDNPEKSRAEARKYDPADWRQRRDRGHSDLAEFREVADRLRAANGGGDPGDGTPLRLVSDARRF